MLQIFGFCTVYNRRINFGKILLREIIRKMRSVTSRSVHRNEKVECYYPRFLMLFLNDKMNDADKNNYVNSPVVPILRTSSKIQTRLVNQKKHENVPLVVTPFMLEQFSAPLQPVQFPEPLQQMPPEQQQQHQQNQPEQQQLLTKTSNHYASSKTTNHLANPHITHPKTLHTTHHINHLTNHLTTLLTNPNTNPLYIILHLNLTHNHFNITSSLNNNPLYFPLNMNLYLHLSLHNTFPKHNLPPDLCHLIQQSTRSYSIFKLTYR